VLSAIAASCTSSDDDGGAPDASDANDTARPDVVVDAPRDVTRDGPSVADASDAAKGNDAADASDARDASEEDAYEAGDPLCAVAASAFDPGALCGVALSVTVVCTHSVTQQAMSAACCAPKTPGLACVPSPTEPDTVCCDGPGTYCGLVSDTSEAIPITLTLRRGPRSGTGACSFGATTTPSATKVSVAAPPAAPGIALALGVLERPRCDGASYTAWLTRTDTATSYAGTWGDHPSASEDLDASGNATVTLNADGTITLEANGTVPMDTGAFTPTWIRRTNVGHCAVTFTP
jgi:hypothetical protein